MKNDKNITYSGKLKTKINIIKEKNIDICYTIESKKKIATPTSMFIDKDNFFMITFDYQELKKIIEGDN